MQPVGARFAGFWARFAAAFIDALILSPFGIAGRIVLAAGPKRIETCSFDATRLCRVPTGSTWALYALITIAGIAAGIAYYGIMEGRTGQTIGKRALGVRVIDVYTGAPIGVGRGIGRYFARIISAIPCFLGYFWMLWDPKKQTWQDKMVSSVVITV